MTDRYTKVLLTIIALSLVWLGVKDTRLEPVVSAQNQGWNAPLQDWDDDPLALGLPNPNLALPDSAAYAYVCYSRLNQGTAFSGWGDYGGLRLQFRSAPNCGGDWIGTGQIFSEGATTNSSHSGYLYSEAALMAYAEMTQRAAAFGQRVTYFRCSDEKTFCIKYLSFKNGPAV